MGDPGRVPDPVGSLRPIASIPSIFAGSALPATWPGVSPSPSVRPAAAPGAPR